MVGSNCGAVEDVVVDAPGEGEGVEAGAGGFGAFDVVGVEEGGGPEAVGLLDGGDFGGHLFEERDVFFARGVIGGHGVEDAPRPAMTQPLPRPQKTFLPFLEVRVKKRSSRKKRCSVLS